MTRHIPQSIPSLTVQAPPSKSLSHRMLIAAALSGGRTEVSNLAFSDDVLATLDCLEALGHHYERLSDSVRFSSYCYNLSGGDAPVVLNCRESGSTMRFILPIALSRGGKYLIEGSARLLERGFDEYIPIFNASGIKICPTDGGCVFEGRLSAGEYSLDCSRSSQYLSALLMALPLCDGGSSISLSGHLSSPSYAALTRAVLSEAGIVINEQGSSYLIEGSQKYAVRDYRVEGDWTNAAYLDAFNFIKGASVRVAGLESSSLQGDRLYPELFEALRRNESPVRLDDNIDLGPVLFAAASLCGHGHFTGTSRLKYKESDRIADMLAELSAFGVRNRVGEDEVEIFAYDLHAPSGTLDSHNDHRLAMALSILAVKFGADLSGAEAVNKSFPDFFERMKI